MALRRMKFEWNEQLQRWGQWVLSGHELWSFVCWHREIPADLREAEGTGTKEVTGWLEDC